MFFKKKEKVDLNKLPKHIAFIMDGNGRWAKKRGMPRSFGHKIGMEAAKKVISHCKKLGIPIVSLYAFSTENWNRPKNEIDTIFELIRDYLKEIEQSDKKTDVCFRHVGFKERLPEDIVQKIESIEDATKNNDGMIVNLCLNYGSRSEIFSAIENMIKDGVKTVDDNVMKKYLQTGEIADPDLIVRASGEQRLSNFMLYQAAYSEFYFPKIFWPDFDDKVVNDAIISFQKRNRRFGSIKE